MIGFLLIDKPVGLTSHDVVNRVRRLTNVKRVGHAGTLDPFATGLLIVGVGREATREFSKLVGLDKDYEAEFTLGASSDTDDRTGRLTQTPLSSPLTKGELEGVMRRFTGEITQMPPNYSAVKVGGKKSYEAARKGETLELKPRTVTVSRFDLVGEPELVANGLRLVAHISCSSGTYIRALARDLGRTLGTGGYVEELRRSRIGPFSISEAIPLSELTPENVESRLSDISSVLGRL